MESAKSSAPAAWDDELLQNPHAAPDKRRRVRDMFAAIAPSYDLNNRLHSLGIDVLWRKKAVKFSGPVAGQRVVDVACGTGDLSLAFASAGAKSVVGIDFTYEMLPIARGKSQSASGVSYACGDAMHLPLPDGCADMVSIAFGIRNVADPAVAIREFRRILTPGGKLAILEFSLPTNPLIRGLYNFYFRKIVPKTATFLSRDRSGAYKYLPQSVKTFIDRAAMLKLMADNGFGNLINKPMTFGVCVCYVGTAL